MEVKYHNDLNDSKQIIVVSSYLTQPYFYIVTLEFSSINYYKSFHFSSSYKDYMEGGGTLPWDKAAAVAAKASFYCRSAYRKCWHS